MVVAVRRQGPEWWELCVWKAQPPAPAAGIHVLGELHVSAPGTTLSAQYLELTREEASDGVTQAALPSGCGPKLRY